MAHFPRGRDARFLDSVEKVDHPAAGSAAMRGLARPVLSPTRALRVLPLTLLSHPLTQVLGYSPERELIEKNYHRLE